MQINTGFKIMMARKGINAGQLAKKLNLGCSTIYATMGQGSDPQLSTLIKYCDAIGCTVEQLIKESEALK